MLSDPERILEGYRAMLDDLEPRRPPLGAPRSEPLVTAVVPYYGPPSMSRRRSTPCSPRPTAGSRR